MQSHNLAAAAGQLLVEIMGIEHTNVFTCDGFNSATSADALRYRGAVQGRRLVRTRASVDAHALANIETPVKDLLPNPASALAA